MPDQALRRRAGHIAPTRAFRLLADEFQIRTDHEDLARRLDFIIPGANQPGTATRTHRFRVMRRDGGYRIAENGRRLGDEPEADRVVDRLHGRIHELAGAQLADRVIIHAGTGVVGGRRFLAVGPKFAGKSTLMTRLLFHGAAAEGDEMAILSAGAVTAFPRRFRIRERALPHVPELAPLLADMPSVVDSEGRRTYGFDPRTAGFDWTIGTGPPDAIFFLAGNHGGDADIAACARIDMCRLIMPQCLSTKVPGPRMLARVAAMVGSARTFIVRGGGPGTTAAAIIRQMGG
jgi:hypothetical protein